MINALLLHYMRRKIQMLGEVICLESKPQICAKQLYTLCFKYAPKKCAALEVELWT